MFRRYKSLCLITFLLVCAFHAWAGANGNKNKGISFTKREITIPLDKLPLSFKTFNADSSVLILTSQYAERSDSVSKKISFGYYKYGSFVKLNGSLANQQDVETLFKSFKDIGYFKTLRLFYFDAQKKINRYIDVDFSAKKNKEIKLLSNSAQTFEAISYAQNGLVSSRTTYRYKDLPSIWQHYELATKIGQTFFYDNGVLKAKVKYENGLLNDTLTTYDKKANIFKQIIYSAGKPVKKIKDDTAVSNHKKALLIGVDQYATPKDYNVTPINKKFIEHYNLAGSVNDVNLLKNTLVAYQGFAAANIKLLTNEQATKKAISNALDALTAKLIPADVVYLHFSGMNFTTKATGEEVFFLASDYYKAKGDTINTYWFTKKEMERAFNAIKKKIGSTGQLIVSYDACGQPSNEKEDKKMADVKFRGESQSILFSSVKYSNVPFMMLSGTSGNELAYETRDSENNAFGLFSYQLANALTLPFPWTDEDLINEIKSNVTGQTPSCFANFPQFVFEPNQVSATVQDFSLPDIAPKGDAHLISVGISNYPKTAKLSFENCKADAESYNAYFTDQYTALTETGIVNSYLLTDSSATKKNILAAINNAMLSKPEDYFVFNFSGYTISLRDSLGKQLTYFVPYGLKNLTDTVEIKKNGISLIQLKELLQMIPANNQLFITEAGSTANFQKEFIKSLIESSPTLASLSNKNRVFMVPKGAGIDNMVCNYQNIKHGPLNYYITNLTDDLSIYGLFEGEAYINALKYALSKVETDCDYLKSGYLDIFFERNFINDLQFFMPNQVGRLRGTRVLNETKQKLISANSKRYAMVIGTNIYKGKPQWGNLNNPVIDAKAIADELETNYDYDVIRLLDQPLDSIYNKILNLSRQLKETDQLIIFVAGHGDFDADLLDDGLIVMNDSKTSKEDPFRNSYIQYSKLSRMINKLPANQILLIMDVCFGGTFDDRVKRDVGRSETSVYDDLNATAYIEGKLNKKTRLFITSGGKREVPDGYAGQHSPFAQRLIMLLQDKGGSAQLLTATNLHQSVEKLPSGPLIGGFGDNVLGSEFLLIPKAKKEIVKPVLNAAKD